MPKYLIEMPDTFKLRECNTCPISCHSRKAVCPIWFAEPAIEALKGGRPFEISLKVETPAEDLETPPERNLESNPGTTAWPRSENTVNGIKTIVYGPEG